MKGSTRQFRIAAIAGGAVLAFGFGLVSALHGSAVSLDGKIQDDFYKGFQGNDDVLKRALGSTEALLKENPKNADALVWHGTGLFYQCGAAFRNNDMDTGMKLFEQGTKEMDDAVDMAPNSVPVRSQRGATLMKATVYMPPEAAQPLLEKAIADYEKIMSQKAASFDKLSVHSRGELLFGLAEGYSRQGDTAKATALFKRVTSELKDTEYAKRSDKWLQTKTLSNEETGCIGCH